MRKTKKLEKIKLLIDSNINFNKFGWVNKASEILEMTPQSVNRWMKKNMQDFYNEKMFR